MEINYNEKVERWDKFVANSPQRSPFVYVKFLNSLDHKYDLVTCYESGKIVAGVVIIFDKNGPIQHPFPFTQYQGILLADNSSEDIHSRIPLEFNTLEFFIGELVRRYKSICLSLSWRFPDMRPLLWLNYHEPEKGIFKVDLRYTAVLDLKKYSNLDDYIASVRRLRRRELKKAQNGLTLEVINDEHIIDDLHTKTFQRQNQDLDEKKSRLVRDITRCALENNFGRLTCAKLNNVPIAAFLSLYDDRTCFHLFAGNHPNYRELGAGTLLVIDTIEESMKRGLKEVDFVGVNSPDRSSYKLSFNPEMKPFFIASFGK